MPEHMRPGMALYRNNDRAFEALLARKSAERKIYIVIEMEPVMAMSSGEDHRVKAVVNIMKTKEADGGLIYQVAEVFKELKLERQETPGRKYKGSDEQTGRYDLRSLPGRTSEGEWRHTLFRTVFSLLSGVN